MGAATLELRSAEGAFRDIEGWLRERGFFAQGGSTERGEDLVADVYLGYGLSATIRRTAAPSPPEPCAPLPLAACSVRPSAYSVVHHANETTRELGSWEATWTAAEYAAAIERVRAAIERGDVYQVNLVQHLSASCPGDPAALGTSLAAALATLRPLQGPFLARDWAVVSASPELFLSRRARRIWTKPIKGRGQPAGERSSAARTRMPRSTS